MPDITMCNGGSCTIKHDCYRYTAKPREYGQSYFMEPPFTKKMGGSTCEHYVSNRKNNVGGDL